MDDTRVAICVHREIWNSWQERWRYDGFTHHCAITGTEATQADALTSAKRQLVEHQAGKRLFGCNMRTIVFDEATVHREFTT